jgi:hypothetical protein
MLRKLHLKKQTQLGLGLVIGIIFGFLLHKGGVTKYDIIIGQLLLTDFTVIKVMLTAIITGMVGVHLLQGLGIAQLHPKPGSFGSAVIGGLLFGVGFGFSGGPRVGAVGVSGCPVRGVAGMLIGTGIFSEFYPRLESFLNQQLRELTWPQALK